MFAWTFAQTEENIQVVMLTLKSEMLGVDKLIDKVRLVVVPSLVKPTGLFSQ